MIVKYERVISSHAVVLPPWFWNTFDHQSLIQVLEPIIVQNEASKTRVFLHCLKCLKEFPKDQAKTRVEKKPKKSSAWTSEEESGSGE